ncbi:MAG: tRNA glutamyl-Q(34) synthetase GluQRS [Gammaproteobacteria bacterium]|nr:tRNA glutamyl-Q(34) synthetase GluQRS [Gammaproteobacteria bacterium]RPG23082.1 MAG: tRNA glutamyl-Q(34) synthetase GluQRS [Gammaproteobacteria bacterium TMED50]|tara:strand:+ start:8207 stop:9073 length:867 start_codon:yes stop_codon:yes gene_type:complete
MVYTGRFAPSPTGPLHLGSLVAALASFLDARHHNGHWLLRIEDLDPPRETDQAAHTIVHQLTTLGLHWDGDILFQSTRLAEYDRVLADLTKKGLTFPCVCSRKQTRGAYNGRCRTRSWQDTTDQAFAIRTRVSDRTITINDRRLGEVTWQLQQDVGDFVVRRKDGLHAYQLAVVVDDAFQQISHVVRGNDLLSSTPRQLHLIQQLGYAVPSYLHLPIMTDTAGFKLSKQHHAPPVELTGPLSVLRRALVTLGQSSQPDADDAKSLLKRASESWSVENIPKAKAIPTPE